MTRHTARGTQRPDGWKVDWGAGGGLHAKSDDDEHVVGTLRLMSDNGSARLRVVTYQHWVSGTIGETTPLSDRPPAPLRWIEHEANRAGTMQAIIDVLHEEPVTTGTEPVPMRLPAMLLAQRAKPASFYERVAHYVRLCKEHGIAYGPRLANDNHVAEGTVRSWVHEARRRGLLEERD